MEVERQFFQVNRDLVYFVYGQVFFLMGFAIALQSRRRSQLELGRHLWLLAGFGLCHGLTQWGNLFIPIQGSRLPGELTSVLVLLQGCLQAVSFFFLFQFGCQLMMTSEKWKLLYNYIPWFALGAWALWFVLLGTVYSPNVDVLFRSGDIISRYVMLLPGAGLTALGLLRQGKEVEEAGLARSRGYLRGTAAVFAVYALAGGLLVADPVTRVRNSVWIAFPGEFILTQLVNAGVVERATGVPVAVFLSLVGAFMMYSIIRTLELFNRETEQLIELMERQQILSLERERIGRELHDGIIQSIYAAGLTLEDTVYSVTEDAQSAVAKIRGVMESLNEIIDDMRSYIGGLRRVVENQDFESRLEALVQEFGAGGSLHTSFHVDASWRRPLTADQSAEIIQIAREALANVARHARARRVDVSLVYGREVLTLEVRDDGVGFEPAKVAESFQEGHGHGMHNMAARATLLDAKLRLQSAPGEGTVVQVEMPYVSEELGVEVEEVRSEQAANIAG